MSERRTRSRSRNRIVAYGAAGLVHAAIIAALVFNFSREPKTIEADYAEKVHVVKATIVDESEIKKQQDKLLREEREKNRKQEQERKRLQRLQEQSEQEKKKIDDLKKAQKIEREKTAKLEAQRKAIALKKQQEEAKRQQQEKLAAEKRRKEQLRQKELARKEREEKEKAEQRLLDERLAAEALLAEQLAKERATTLKAKHAALIIAKVYKRMRILPDFERWRTTVMNVRLSPSGDVLSVRVVKPSGDERYDRAVETAIYQASPLPIPSAADDPEIHKEFQDLDLNFDLTGM